MWFTFLLHMAKLLLVAQSSDEFYKYFLFTVLPAWHCISQRTRWPCVMNISYSASHRMGKSSGEPEIGLCKILPRFKCINIGVYQHAFKTEVPSCRVCNYNCSIRYLMEFVYNIM